LDDRGHALKKSALTLIVQTNKLSFVTPDPVTDALPLQEKQVPSTAGMTTKVVKGSIWTLAGQVVPLMATLVTTPFVIRILGSESYGVLLLVGLIPNYFTFDDFWMVMASTKFASEAYGRGDLESEAAVVRTAALIAFLSSSAIALPMIVFAGSIVAALNVPEHLLSDGTLALRLTACSFIAANLSNVFNTPQLARLRMDLNAAINASGRVILAFGTVVVLYLGGGIGGAAAFGLAIALLTLSLHLIVSSRLVRGGFEFTFNRDLARPMLRFGGGMLISGIAGILLINSEKLLLTKLVSVQALAYYSVAFTFANMATMFSWAMVQSLVPAFSQLLTPEKRGQFDALFARGVRLCVAGLLPTLLLMFVIGRPFFTVWAGEEFGRESTLPFYILIAGFFFNIIAYASHATVTAVGRTDVFAKLYFAELLPYFLIAIIFINYFGIVGAAAAWALRVGIDAIVLIYLAKRIANIRFRYLDGLRPIYLSSLVFLIPVGSILVGVAAAINVALAVASIVTFAVLIWFFAADDTERSWFTARFTRLVRI
jgi:O-antigen/teichoic acid export membrane protein